MLVTTMPATRSLPYKVRRRLRRLFNTWLGPAVRSVVTPPLPRNLDGRVLVHIGCGDLNDPRYTNVDARPMPHIHYVTKDMRLQEISPSSVDLIYACHVLEHFSFRDVPETLAQWRGKLREGGVLRLSVPDFACIVRIYEATQSVESVIAPLMGEQNYPTNYHYTAFDAKSLTDHLRAAGFSSVRTWDPKMAADYSFDDWAGRPVEVDGQPFPISLNLEAVR